MTNSHGPRPALDVSNADEAAIDKPEINVLPKLTIPTVLRGDQQVMDTLQKLVLTDESLSSPSHLTRDLGMLRAVNEAFDIGIPTKLLQRGSSISRDCFLLGNPDFGSTSDLLYLAIAKKLSNEDKRRIDEEGMKDDRHHIDTWRKIGCVDLADHMAEWQDLSDDVEIIISEDAETAWPQIANLDDIERRAEIIRARAQPYVEKARFSSSEISALVCRKYDLELRTSDEFNRYWLELIIGSKGFPTFRADHSEDGWYLSDKPFGWLTQRHASALERHGYTYRFAFWEQPVGEMRGHLWIQTDKGALVLSDETYAMSNKSYFPVQVSSLDGRPLFELRAEDVSDELMNSGPDVPNAPSARIHGRSQRKPRSWWDQVTGKT